MSKGRWHILQDGDSVTVTRLLPCRYDVGITSVLRRCDRPLRLAQQVRQDLWRALRDLRGFAPAVTVTQAGETSQVTAGGRIEGPLPRARIEARIAAMLERPELRARWMAHAGARQ